PASHTPLPPTPYTTLFRSIPAPVAPEHLSPQSLEILLPRPEVGGILRRTADSVNRWMLKEDQGIRYLISLAERDQFSLQLPPFRDRKSTRLNSRHDQISYA